MIKHDFLKETILKQKPILVMDGSISPEYFYLIFWLIYKDGEEFRGRIHSLSETPFVSLIELWEYANKYFEGDTVELEDPIIEQKEGDVTPKITGYKKRAVPMIAVAPISDIPEAYKEHLVFAYETKNQPEPTGVTQPQG